MFHIVVVMASVDELSDLHSGGLCKVGGKIKTWHKRFFVLKSDYCLYYYKDTAKPPLGSISLHTPYFNVRRGDVEDISWPKQAKPDCRMVIMTESRTYCVYADYCHEIEEWMEELNKAVKKVACTNGDDSQILTGNPNVSFGQRDVKSGSARPGPLLSIDSEDMPEMSLTGGGSQSPVLDAGSLQEESFYAIITNSSPTNSEGPSPQSGQDGRPEGDQVLHENSPHMPLQSLYDAVGPSIDDSLEESLYVNNSHQTEDQSSPKLPSTLNSSREDSPSNSSLMTLTLQQPFTKDSAPTSHQSPSVTPTNLSPRASAVAGDKRRTSAPLDGVGLSLQSQSSEVDDPDDPLPKIEQQETFGKHTDTHTPLAHTHHTHAHPPTTHTHSHYTNSPTHTLLLHELTYTLTHTHKSKFSSCRQHGHTYPT